MRFLIGILCFLGVNLMFTQSTALAQYKLDSAKIKFAKDIQTGADKLLQNVDLLQNKRLALVVNHTSLVAGEHLLDKLLEKNLDIKRVFAPEHGFRGESDAGAHINSGVDDKTGIPLVSLYGKTKKPSEQHLADVDIVIFDIQDVGVRYYTYISTMHYVMQAAAEQNKEVWVLDRPNPNGFYVDGPMLEKGFESFVGVHPIPLVHGLTVGELAQMINGENWLGNKLKCKLKVITCQNYSHSDLYQLPVKPSPNLPNMTSVYLYPSLGLFEGTPFSIGRGTDAPFQVLGHPEMGIGDFYFTPESKPGASNPPQKGKKCRGFDLQGLNTEFAHDFKGIYLKWLLLSYSHFPNKESFFLKNKFFDLLAGTSKLRIQMTQGVSESEIRDSWKEDTENYKTLRKKYLLYSDFE
jgi:uncharacterized protein YbbC (DUF1343 family)